MNAAKDVGTRFWVPRSGHIDLSDGGFLVDPALAFFRSNSPPPASLLHCRNPRDRSRPSDNMTLEPFTAFDTFSAVPTGAPRPAFSSNRKSALKGFVMRFFPAIYVFAE